VQFLALERTRHACSWIGSDDLRRVGSHSCSSAGFEVESAGRRLRHRRNAMQLKAERAMIALVSYLHGLRDGGVELGHASFAFPQFLDEAIEDVMTEAAQTDENAPDPGRDPFDRWGKWHRAANILTVALDRVSKQMTQGYEYPEGLPRSDRLHEALMGSMRRHKQADCDSGGAVGEARSGGLDADPDVPRR